jgi:two-component system, NtrC family, sensor histidine kinase PilS
MQNARPGRRRRVAGCKTAPSLLTTQASPRARSPFEPTRLVRWVYVGRLAISLAIFLAAVFVWRDARPEDTLIASLNIIAAMVFTGASAVYSEIYRRSTTAVFHATQAVFDLGVVTAIVHITGGGSSQFAALYILVIAISSLTQSATSGLLIAGLGCLLYFGDVILAYGSTLDLGLWLQLGVFAGVALSAGYVAARLREAHVGHEELAAELVKVRLQAADILRNIRSGIVTVDSHGTLVYANPAASALLGIELEPYVGTAVLDVIEPVSPTLALALERAAARGVRTSRGEGRVTTRARQFPIGLNTTVTSEDTGNGGGTATAIFQDISDQKRLDTLHLRTQRLEAVAELSASLAHEIRNPLASIRSAVEQIGNAPRASADEQTLAGLIVRESDRLSRLLSEFLDFARVRVSRVQQLDISAVARGVSNLAATNASRLEGVTVDCVTPQEPLLIEGDEDLLHRALFNLVLNALQASPPNGTVAVEVAALGRDEVPAGVTLDRGVIIRVADNGPGIPLEIRDRLFDPFFTTKPGGSGLGLAVVHRAIEAHRGYVFVDSDDRGTRVTVLLPVHHTGFGDAS